MGRRLTLSYVISEIEKVGYKLLSKTYANNSTKLRILCDKNHEFSNTLYEKFYHLDCLKEIIIVSIGNTKYKLYLTQSFQQIGDTKFMIKSRGRNYLAFQVMKQEPIKETKEPEEKIEINKKGEVNMGLSLGTWIMLIIVMIIVSRFSSKLRLRTLFRPTKKVTKTIKKEWDES